MSQYTKKTAAISYNDAEYCQEMHLCCCSKLARLVCRLLLFAPHSIKNIFAANRMSIDNGTYRLRKAIKKNNKLCGNFPQGAERGTDPHFCGKNKNGLKMCFESF